MRQTSAHAIGERAGMKRGHISHVINGDRRDIKCATLLALARALDVTTDWLLTGEGPITRTYVEVAHEAPTDPRATRLKAAADAGRAALRATKSEARQPALRAARRADR